MINAFVLTYAVYHTRWVLNDWHVFGDGPLYPNGGSFKKSNNQFQYKTTNLKNVRTSM
jgi:hypothetical protein